MKAFIIGIGGVSRSGKSFLAGNLMQYMEKEGFAVEIFDQDDYVFPENQIPRIRNHIDWECPESVDILRLQTAIGEAKDDFDCIIVEGLMVYYFPELYNVLNYRIFIELGEEEFIKRKREDLRWGKEPEWYIRHIWDSYNRFGRFPEPNNPDVLLHGEGKFDIAGIGSNIKQSLKQ